MSGVSGEAGRRGGASIAIKKCVREHQHQHEHEHERAHTRSGYK